MEKLSRRKFTGEALASLATFCLLKTAYEGDLFAQAVKPVTDGWLRELHQLCGDLRVEKVSQIQWQRQVTQLFARIEMAELLRFIDFERLEKQVRIPDEGVAVERVAFPQPGWMPDERGWGMSLFTLDKGRAVMPHGHHNMVSMHLVLKGTLHVRHYDRVEEGSQHVVMRPSVDRRSSAGGATTISDDKDNIHWLQNIGDGKAFTLDVVVSGLDPGLGFQFKQFYVDPLGSERVGDGLVRARKIGFEEASRLYGRS